MRKCGRCRVKNIIKKGFMICNCNVDYMRPIMILDGEFAGIDTIIMEQLSQLPFHPYILLITHNEQVRKACQKEIVWSTSGIQWFALCGPYIKKEPTHPTRRFSYSGWCTAYTYFIALQRPVFLEPSRTIKSFWTRTLMALSTVLVDMLSWSAISWRVFCGAFSMGW